MKLYKLKQVKSAQENISFPVWLAKELTEKNTTIPNENFEEDEEDINPLDIEIIRQWVEKTNPDLNNLSFKESLIKANDWMVNLLKNPNCPPDILEEILKSEDYWVSLRVNWISGLAAKNPNCPPYMLAEILKRGKDDDVSRCAACNPNCPPEALTEILREGRDDDVSRYAAINPKCPQEMIIEILKRGKDDLVSQFAARNPNCPPSAKIQWEKSIRRIKRKKKLVSFNLKQYKMAKENISFPVWLAKELTEKDKTITNKDFITPTNIDVVQMWVEKTNPDLNNLSFKDAHEKSVRWMTSLLECSICPPEILTEILKRGKDDWISIWAAENLNCPPEILTEILKREKDDDVSRYAVLNPNCPPEILTEILKRGKDDVISRYAAANLNCPPESLGEVLKRGKYDIVSEWAAKNPNCPPLAKVQWEKNNLLGKIKQKKQLRSFNLKQYKMAKENYPVWLAKELTDPSNYPLPQHLQDPKNIEIIRQWIAETNPPLSNLNIRDAWEKASEDQRIRKYKKTDEYDPEEIHRNINRFIAESQNINPNDPNFAVDLRIKEKAASTSMVNKANKEIHELGSYHNEIPLQEIFSILKKYGFVPLQEDGAKWSGMLIGASECGSDNAINQRANFVLSANIKYLGYVPVNRFLHLTWCTMPSGKYEIVAYVGY